MKEGLKLIKKLYKFARLDIKVLNYMTEKGGFYKTTTLAKVLGNNLSAIQRSVKTLYDKGFLVREQENLIGGGYVFSYETFSRKIIVPMVRVKLETVYSQEYKTLLRFRRKVVGKK